MKQLTCEMCGSTELLKQDGVFVCQTCGCKYSVEEAKKMMIEGTVDVQGTIKVDESVKIDNYLSLAEAAFEGQDEKSVIEYVDKALEIDINNRRAWVLRAKTIGWGGALADKKIAQALTAAKKAIQLTPEDEKTEIADNLVSALSLQIAGLRRLASDLHSDGLAHHCVAAWNHMHEIMLLWKSVLKLPHVSKELIRAELVMMKKLHDDAGKSTRPGGGTIYSAMSIHNGGEPYYITFKKELLPDELIEELTEEHIEEKTPPKGGCYVATCVYGSYDCPQVWTLRRYRDNTLGSTWYGRAFIRTYYAISPTLVKWFGETKWFKKMWKGRLDKMVAKLQNYGVEDTPYEDKEW